MTSSLGSQLPSPYEETGPDFALNNYFGINITLIIKLQD